MKKFHVALVVSFLYLNFQGQGAATPNRTQMASANQDNGSGETQTLDHNIAILKKYQQYYQNLLNALNKGYLVMPGNPGSPRLVTNRKNFSHLVAAKVMTGERTQAQAKVLTADAGQLTKKMQQWLVGEIARIDKKIDQLQNHQSSHGGSSSQSASSTNTSADLDLGTQWSEIESGISGTWKRRGHSAIWDARWGGITAELVISSHDNTVSIVRRNSSDGNNCQYTGTIQPGDATVKGTYMCNHGTGQGGNPWSAKMMR